MYYMVYYVGREKWVITRRRYDDCAHKIVISYSQGKGLLCNRSFEKKGSCAIVYSNLVARWSEKIRLARPQYKVQPLWLVTNLAMSNFSKVWQFIT